jgi:hypothetical protein
MGWLHRYRLRLGVKKKNWNQQRYLLDPLPSKN